METYLSQGVLVFRQKGYFAADVPTGTAGFQPTRSCRQDTGGPRGRHIKRSPLSLH